MELADKFNVKTTQGKIIFRPNSKQQMLALASKATELFLGGLPGGGKSKLVVARKVVGDTNGIPRVNNPYYEGWTFRRNEDQLSGLIRYAEDIFPAFGGKPTERGMHWEFPQGGTHDFTHMANPDSWKQVQGHNVSDMDFDELPEFEKDQYNMATIWCRAPHPTLPSRITCTGNPIGPGVAWVKEYFVQRCAPFHIHNIIQANGKAITRQFIPYGFRDNPDLLAAEPDYEARLHLISNPTIRKAMLSENVMDAWNISIGAFFDYSSEEHLVLKEEEDATRAYLYNTPGRWVRAYDYGGKEATCMLWMVKHKDRVYVTDEYYVENEPTEDVHIPEIKRYQSLMTDKRGNPRIDSTVGDPSIWKEHKKLKYTSETVGQVWQRNGIYIEKAFNDLIPGLQRLQAAFHYRPGLRPELQIFESCENLLREIQAAVTDDKNLELIDRNCSDHALDCLRYGLMHLEGRQSTETPAIRPGSIMDDFQRLLPATNYADAVGWE